MLAHMLRRAMGTTGICWPRPAARSTIRSMPRRNGAIPPSAVSRPSGKIATSSPSAKVRSISSNARCISAGSSFSGAIGIARAVRKIQRSTGISKIRWYITKRTGRGVLAARISASM